MRRRTNVPTHDVTCIVGIRDHHDMIITDYNVKQNFTRVMTWYVTMKKNMISQQTNYPNVK